MRRMARTITLAFTRPLSDPAELLRKALVVSCALALILAGPAIPSVL